MPEVKERFHRGVENGHETIRLTRDASSTCFSAKPPSRVEILVITAEVVLGVALAIWSAVMCCSVVQRGGVSESGFGARSLFFAANLTNACRQKPLLASSFSLSEQPPKCLTDEAHSVD
jgi:hypothetical protein